MATESVTVKIDAENKASAELRKLAFDAEKSAKNIKEVGGQAKASTEVVGALATSLGGSSVGGFAGEIAMLTERVSAFSDVAKQGGAGAMAFKAGLVAAAAVISFKVGTALGDAIFQTDAWRQKLDEANSAAKRLNAELISGLGRSFDQRLNFSKLVGGEAGKTAFDELAANVEKNVDTSSARLGKLKKQLEVFESRKTSFTVGFGASAALQARFSNRGEQLKKEIDEETTKNQLLKAQNQRIQEITGERQKNIAALQAQQANEKRIVQAQSKSSGVLDKLLRQHESLTLSARELMQLEIERNTTVGFDRKRAEALADQIALVTQLADAEKKAADQKTEHLNALIKLDQDNIRQLQAKANEVRQQMRQSQTLGSSTPLQAGSDQRGITGKAGAEFRKTAAVIEAERQTKLQTKMEILLKRVATATEAVERNQQQLEVIGD